MTGVDRRSFLRGGALATGIGASASAMAHAPAFAADEVVFPTDRNSYSRGGSIYGPMSRAESDLYDCEIDGELPDDLDGVFYRVGPDFQYPKGEHLKPNSWFDGEGHISMFRIKDGHVDYKSRWIRNTRWKLQHAARKSLFGVYRNPASDDPSVRGKNRAEHNTQVWFHNGQLLALKEDTPPALIDPLTLECKDDWYTFGGQLKSQTFTAHPKTDSVTGEMVAFGYEARGDNTTDINVFSYDAKGKKTWDVWVKAPYVGMLHDWAVTDKHIAFLAIPLAYNRDGIPQGEVHWAWDSSLPTYLGVMRRGGDGKDLRWVKGPQTMCTHTMGAWSDGDKIYVDMDGGDGNQFSFFPSRTEAFDPVKAAGTIRRFSLDLSSHNNDVFTMERLHPQVSASLSRQDDRYHTQPYRWGFTNTTAAETRTRAWSTIDHQTGKVKTFALPNTNLSEMVFVPRKRGAAEGDGYLIGVGARALEGNRSDIFIVDAQKPDEGPIATIMMPFKVPPQIHGIWVPGDQLPKDA